MKDFCESVAILIPLFLWTTGAADEVLVYGPVGGTVILPKEGEFNDPYVYWYFGTDPVFTYNPLSKAGKPSDDSTWKTRVSLKKDRSEKDFSLVINNMRKEEFTSFTCEVIIKDTVVSTTHYLLHSVSVPAVLPLLSGDRLSLHCDVQEPQRPVGIQVDWRSPQEKVRRSTSERSLTVEKVTLEDHGEWRCVVHYGSKQAHASTSVNVMDLSPPQTETLYTSVSLSRPLLLPCSIPQYGTWEQLQDKGLQEGHWSFTPRLASGAPGTPQRLLSFNLSLAKPSVRVVLQEEVAPYPSTWGKAEFSALLRDDRDLCLSLKRVTEGHRGEYTCTLEFKNRVPLKRTVRVEVLRVLSSGGPELQAGHQLNLTCSLGRPLTPDLKVKWVSPRSSPSRVSLGPAPHPDHLVIPGAALGDSGKWKCELIGTGGTAEITLKIGRAPMDKWLLVTICAASVIFILLLILTVILLRRRRQRAMRPRRPRHRFCRCKDPQPKGFYRT